MSGLPLNINIQQVLLHMLNFVILAGALYFLLYKPVSDFMAKRKAYFESLEKEAQDKKQEADNILLQYQAKIKEAEDDAKAIKTKANQAADAIIKHSKEEAEIESKKILEDAHVQAEKEKDKIITNAEHEIVELVLAAEKKILQSSQSSAAVQTSGLSEETK